MAHTLASNPRPHSQTDEPLPYAASLLDRFFDWVRNLPLSTPVFYLGFWFLLFLAISLMAWMEGGEPAEYPLTLAWDGALFMVYYLALMHYLDGVAGRALNTFRPLLQMDDSTVARLRYELTTLPARSTWIAGGIGLLVTLAGLPFLPSAGPIAVISRHVSAQVTFSASNFILGIFIYHTIRQLFLVNQIQATATRVNLYRRDPVYAFSQLTARTGIGWVLGLSLGLIPRIGPALTREGVLWTGATLLPLALLLFILPLLSVHRLLIEEKRRLQGEVNERLEMAFGRLHTQMDANDTTNIGGTKTGVDSLLVERDSLDRMPTWPWRPGTLAGFTSALLVPVIIWFVQQILMDLLR